jgi:phenylpropionate dioxygenase-like ring-hydroxylating dioxygenase large terminal subunit
MQKTRHFDKSVYDLIPIKLETWDGFVFINFDPDSISLREYLGDLPDRLAPYTLSEMVCVRRKEYDVACNWKLFVENAKESLHIATVHRKTINRYADAESSRYDVEPANGQYVITFAQHKGSMALLTGDQGFPKIETLTGKEADGTYAPLIYPSTYLGCTIDTVWYLDVRSLGPGRITMIHGACFPKRVVTRPDFEEIVKNYYRRWDITSDEDIQTCEWQQKGVESPFCRPGRFSYREPLVHEIDNWVLDRVIGPRPARATAK